MESVNKKMFKITPPSQTGGGGGGRGGKYSGNGQHHHAGGQMQPRDGGGQPFLILDTVYKLTHDHDISRHPFHILWNRMEGKIFFKDFQNWTY